MQNWHSLLVVRNDLKGDGHQITSSDHLLLLQTPRMLVVAMMLMQVVVLVVAARVLMRWQTV
jgi:hypothetical protein